MKTISSLVFIIFVVCLADSHGFAQRNDNEPPIEQDNLLPGVSIFDASMKANRQRPCPSELELLCSPSVQKELELVADQMSKLESLQKEYSDQMSSSMEELRNGTMTGEAYAEQLVNLKARQSIELESLLLPHQQKRLQQVRTQTLVGRAGLVGAISQDEISKKLNLTQAQKDELKKLKKAFDNRLIQTFKKLKEDHKKSILKVLTDQQQDDLTALFGESFVAKKNDVQKKR